MIKPFKLTEPDIRSLANSQSFDRGYNYYRNGYVYNMTRRGDLLASQVEGSQYEPYQVQVTLSEHGVEDAECTCPYDWGGNCKHIVATLLYFIHNHEVVEKKPELATLLAGLTEAQLRQILLHVAEDQPDFVSAIEREIKWLQ